MIQLNDQVLQRLMDESPTAVSALHSATLADAQEMIQLLIDDAELRTRYEAILPAWYALITEIAERLEKKRAG